MGRDAYADEIESRDRENRDQKFARDHSIIDESRLMRWKEVSKQREKREKGDKNGLANRVNENISRDG